MPALLVRAAGPSAGRLTGAWGLLTGVFGVSMTMGYREAFNARLQRGEAEAVLRVVDDAGNAIRTPEYQRVGRIVADHMRVFGALCLVTALLTVTLAQLSVSGVTSWSGRARRWGNLVPLGVFLPVGVAALVLGTQTADRVATVGGGADDFRALLRYVETQSWITLGLGILCLVAGWLHTVVLVRLGG
jgi:hypothetical protein